MMTTATHPQSVRTMLELARPYLYRRQGRYTLRVRPLGSKETLSVSLKTTNRQSALATAAHLLGTLRAFHLDTPDATWQDLKENLLDIAKDILKTRSVWDQFGDTRLVYRDVRKDLNEISSTEPLSIDQARAVRVLTGSSSREPSVPSTGSLTSLFGRHSAFRPREVFRSTLFGTLSRAP